MQKIAPVAIRRANIVDADALISLEQDALGGVFGRTGLTDWSSLFAESGVFTYLAEDTEPFGVIAVGNPRETMHRDGNTGEVIAWYLHPRYQESGFGKNCWYMACPSLNGETSNGRLSGFPRLQ